MSMSLRKALLIFLCAILFLAASPKQGHTETIGIIATRGVSSYDRLHTALQAHLAKKGYGQKIKFIIQRPYPDHIAWINASRKLISADVDIIITYGTPATLSAIGEKPRIPILYAGVYEPIAASIRGKNVTGVCSKYQVSSLLRYLRATTSLKNLGVIYCSMEEDSKHQLLEIKEMSKKYGFALSELNLRRPGDIAGMLADINFNALFITSSSMVNSVFPTIMRITEGKKIPTASLFEHGDLNATIMLSSNPEEEGRIAADMLIRFLNGTSLKSIHPICSKDIDLVFNLKGARSMGIRVSMDLVTEATRIIY
jgi:putative ABC transport system substrate-binding protein